MNTVRIYALAQERKSPQFFLETDDLLDLTLVTFLVTKTFHNFWGGLLSTYVFRELSISTSITSSVPE